MADKITQEFYNGDVVIIFYPKSHRYKIEKVLDKDVAELNKTKSSGTSAPNIIDKSQVLINWAINQYERKMKELAEGGANFTVQDLENMIELAKKEWRNVRDTAGNIGSMVHRFAELYVTSEQMRDKELFADEKLISDVIDKIREEFADEFDKNDDAVYAGIKAFFDWVKQYKPVVKNSERLCYSIKNNHLGIYDVDFELLEEHVGKDLAGLYLGDFKTSNGIYSEHKIQLSSYLKAREEEMEYVGEKTKYKGGMIIAFAKEDKEKDGEIIKKAGSCEVEIISRKELVSLYKVYKHCQAIEQFTKAEKAKYYQNNK